MSVATSTAIAITAGVGAAGAIGGAAIQSSAAGKAANAEENATKNAADIQKQESDAALQFQRDQWNTQQQNLAPWLTAGKGALGTLSGLLSTPGQGLLTPFSEQFQAPTGATEQNDPGYQFRLKQGMDALNNSAAAKGNLLSGNTLQAQQKFGQDYASNEYNNVYSRAMQEFLNRYNIFKGNQTDQYNRLAGLAGTGQQAATTLGQLGQNAANNFGNISLETGRQLGQDYQNLGAAQASGYVNSANAWSGGLTGAANTIGQMPLLSQLLGMPSGGNSNLYSYYNPNLSVANGPSYLSGGGNVPPPSLNYGPVNMSSLPM